MSDDTKEDLSEIVRGEWEPRIGSIWECAWRAGMPTDLFWRVECLNAGKWRAHAEVKLDHAVLHFSSGVGFDSATAAIRDALDRWREDIERYAGTVHPEELEAHRRTQRDLFGSDTPKRGSCR